MIAAVAFVALALLLGAASSAQRRRVAKIAALGFELRFPPVPEFVLDAVAQAEARHYAGRSATRRALEHGQDAMSRRLPELVAYADWSVGRYRVRPSTLARLLPWALAEGYFVLHDAPPSSTRAALAYFATVRGTDAWQAAVVMEHLRCDHPHLRRLGWDAIAHDPRLVALLYSGYLGAGGDWDAWRASAEPGPEALRRMAPDARAAP